MNTILVLALFVALASCFTDLEYQTSFTNWMQEHKKSYAATEFQARFAIFKSNMDYVDQWNAAGSQTVLGLTAFADLTNEEYQKTYLGTRIQKTPVVVEDTAAPADLPASVDWRTEGAVTPIKNQGQCGSCWSFSTTGSVEGIHKINGGSLVSLSEQNLMDCSSKFGDMGCNGGLMDDAFKYIIANKGVDTEASYPYEAKVGTCRFSESNVGATITGYTDVTSGSESALQSAAVTQPISVAIDASHNSFQLYKSGVYYEKACSSSKLDHGVLVIGYGTSGSSDYWLVKNSWGTTWGQDGYIWMSRNRNNNCGIATSASYPTGGSDLTAKPTTSTTHKPTTTTTHSIATVAHTVATSASHTSQTSQTQTSQSSHQTQTSQSSYSNGVLNEAMYKPIGGKGFKPSKDQAAKFNF